MDNIIKITLIGLVTGITGTGTGGLAVFFIKDMNPRFLSFILEFVAGLMTAVVCFELIPEAFSYGGTASAFIGILIGVLTIMIVEEFITRAGDRKQKNKKTGLLRAGILMAVGISLHNFPEGFAVGAGFGASTTLGIMLTTVIMIHDIPEGIAMAIPLRAGGFSKSKAFLITVLSGVPMGIGALAGAVLGGISKGFIGTCLGFAAGAMLYVIYGELIAESRRLHTGRLSPIGNLMGFVCGVVVTLLN